MGSGLCCLSWQDDGSLLRCLDWKRQAQEPSLIKEPAAKAEITPNDVGYVLEKALATLKRKLKENEEVTEEMVYQLPSSETQVAKDVLVPVKMGANSNVDIVHVKQMIEKLGPKGAAEEYAKAAECFEGKLENE